MKPRSIINIKTAARIKIYCGGGDIVVNRHLCGIKPQYFRPNMERGYYWVNIPEKGLYSLSDNCRFLGKTELKFLFWDFELPRFERKYEGKEAFFTFKPSIYSPAMMNRFTGERFVNEELFTFPIEWQNFILEHETGHNFYQTEKYCDLYALKAHIKKGFNASQCLECLKFVLSDSPEKEERVSFIEQKIKQLVKLTYGSSKV